MDKPLNQKNDRIINTLPLPISARLTSENIWKDASAKS